MLEHIDTSITELFNEWEYLNGWERRFLISIQGNLTFSDKQEKCLNKIHERALTTDELDPADYDIVYPLD